MPVTEVCARMALSGSKGSALLSGACASEALRATEPVKPVQFRPQSPDKGCMRD